MLMDWLVVVFSLLMLVYWFHYTCILILYTKSPKDDSKQVADANQLKVFEVRYRLATSAEVDNLDELKRMLDRDYQLIMYLMRHGANFKTAGYELHDRMLMLHYQLLKLVYGLSKQLSLSRSPSRQHLLDMANVIAHFANRMGQRVALGEL